MFKTRAFGIMLLACGLFLSQSCDAWFFQKKSFYKKKDQSCRSKKNRLREEAESLNKSMRKLDDEQKKLDEAWKKAGPKKMPPSGELEDLLSSLRNAGKELDRKIDGYMDCVVENPKVVVNLKPEIYYMKTPVARMNLVRGNTANKLKLALEKCMKQHFKKDCEEAFSHVADCFFNYEGYTHEDHIEKLLKLNAETRSRSDKT